MDALSKLLSTGLQTLLPLIAAGALAYLAYRVLRSLFSAFTRQRQVNALETFATPAAYQDPTEARPGTDAYKIRLAFASMQVDAAGRETFVVYAAYGVVAVGGFLVLLIVGLPALVALVAAGGLSYFVVQGWLAGHWRKARLEVEKEIPTLMRNLSGVLQTQPNVPLALQTVLDTLDPTRPLAPWMRYLLTEAQTYGVAVLEQRLLREAHAISSALGLVVFELHRLWTVGGAGYPQALRLTATNLAALLQVRAQAQAIGAGATGLARLIIGVAVVTLGYLISSPFGKQVFLGNSLVVILMAVAVGWGVFGWKVIGETVADATE